MIDNGYFGEETVPEPHEDEAMLFEEFCTARLRMPPHPVLTDILLKYQIQIHHITPNAIVQLLKYIWAVTSFGGVLSAEGFAKRYELHYQPRKMDVDDVEMVGQYGCINFQAKRETQRSKLIVAVKNKWIVSWPQEWFYCKVSLIRSPSPRRDKGVYALHSYMATLCYISDPPSACANDDASDGAFEWATRTISGRDAVEEYLANVLLPLLVGFGLGEVTERETPMSKLSVPSTEYPVARLPIRLPGCREKLLTGVGRGWKCPCWKLLGDTPMGSTKPALKHCRIGAGLTTCLSTRASRTSLIQRRALQRVGKLLQKGNEMLVLCQLPSVRRSPHTNQCLPMCQPRNPLSRHRCQRWGLHLKPRLRWPLWGLP
jgi:hypothetical protein